MNELWTILKSYVVSLRPLLISLMFGLAVACLDALGAYFDSGSPLKWKSLFSILGSAAFGYILTKAHSANTLSWIKALLLTADTQMSPREALVTAAAQVQPLTPLAKIEEKVFYQQVDPAPQVAPVLEIVPMPHPDGPVVLVTPVELPVMQQAAPLSPASIETIIQNENIIKEI